MVARQIGDHEINFEHRQSAHCESGVTANLLHHYGVEMSEALAFGIGSGLFFGYIPFIKINNLPLTTFRISTGGIFNRTMKRLGVSVETKRFRNRRQAMKALDQKIMENIPTGCQTGGFWLPYFPAAYRFHFNMHNLVVYGKQKDNYMISDPIFSDPVLCQEKDLEKARFAKGALAPKGRMYWLSNVPKKIDFKVPVQEGIQEVCNTMTKTPVPILGVTGIRFLAKRMLKWPHKLGHEKAALYLGQVIRMQEEIGTGGAGFRFIFGAFLQEASEILDKPALFDISKEMTETGDLWREFAVVGAKHCKGRLSAEETYPEMSKILLECAGREEDIFKKLMKI